LLLTIGAGCVNPKKDILTFFHGVELIYRQSVIGLKDVNNESEKAFIQNVIAKDNLTALLSNATPQCDEGIDTAVLKYMLSIYYLVRCGGKCKQYMQRKLLQDKRNKKQNAMRKTLH